MRKYLELISQYYNIIYVKYSTILPHFVQINFPTQENLNIGFLGIFPFHCLYRVSILKKRTQFAQSQLYLKPEKLCYEQRPKYVRARE